MKTRELRWVVSLTFVAVGVTAPLEWENGRFIVAAACADGTCCPEPRSDCIINNIVALDHFRKVGAGPCRDPSQPLPPP